jgi:hypothetical protein
VFIAINSESFKATDQRTAYVAITRGKEQAVIFTDDQEELIKAATRAGQSLTATELVDSLNNPAGRSSAEVFANRRLGWRHPVVPEMAKSVPSQEITPNREHDHAR